MPEDPSPNPAQERLIARQFAQEDAAARRLLRLLSEARTELQERLGGLAVPAMLSAVEEAVERLRVGLEFGLTDATAEAAALGIRLAEAGLPPGVPFSLPDELLRAVSGYEATLVQNLTSELRGRITETIGRGVLAGTNNEAMAAEIVSAGLQPLGPFPRAEQRAEAIVRTEVNRVANMSAFARYESAAQELPGMKKQWLATTDARTRESHIEANGQTVGMDEDFIVGGEACRYPVDPRLSVGNSINCRCRMIVVFPEGE